MASYYIQWLDLLARWLHMITGVAWIGASFYFVWLDNHLLPAESQQDAADGVAGEVWSVHGGGFYHAQKYKLAPPRLPKTLHWFKWEAYSTWLSGVFLLALVYWYGAEVYTIDGDVMALSKSVAVVIGIATLAGGWWGYDFLCRSKLKQNDKLLGIAIAVFVCLMAYALCHLFSGRAAYIHFGAMLGTIMVANVFFIIIPGQQALVKAAASGGDLDPRHGIIAKQRSVHNTFFTLPVLFVMMSNHYAMTYAHPLNWLVLIGMCLVGGLIRVYFVQRHFAGRNQEGNQGQSLLPLIAAALVLLAVIFLVAPKSVDDLAPANHSTDNAPSDGGVDDKGDSKGDSKGEELETAQLWAKIKPIIAQRCASCHAASPTQAGFAVAPKGVLLETEAQINRHASVIYAQTVLTKAMPIGNLTQMTAAERGLIKQWYKAITK